MPHRREKYADLCDNPGGLFQDCFVVLFPLDIEEIWVGDGERCGFRIRAERSKDGLCLHISNFDGSPPITVVNSKDTEVDLCETTDHSAFNKNPWQRQHATLFRQAMEN